MIIELAESTPDAAGAHLNLLKPPYVHEGLSLAVAGNKGSGKSHTLAVMAEEAHRNHLPFIFYDPNGDAAGLRELGDDVVIIGRPDSTDPVRRGHFSLRRAIDDPVYYLNLALVEGYSLVIDLSGISVEVACEAFAALAGAHFRLAGELREPCMTIVDEAHTFAPQSRLSDEQKRSLKIFINLMSDGRKRGVLLALATQRATYLSKDVLALANVRMFGKITWYPDFEVIRPYLPPGVAFSHLQSLHAGGYYLVSQNRWGQIQVKERRTPDLGKTPVISCRVERRRPSIQDLQLPLQIPGTVNVRGWK